MVRSFLAIKFTSKSERRLLSLCLNNPENDPETNQWNKNAVRDLLRKLRKQPHLIDELEKAISQQCPTTKCIPIPKTADRRLFIAHRRGLPQVIYSRLWRWPDLQSHHQIRAISTCESSVESASGVDQPNRSQTVCINPYHYERPDPKPIDSILIATSKIPPDLSTSFEDSGTTGGTRARPSDYVPSQQQAAQPIRQQTITGQTIRSILSSTITDFAASSTGLGYSQQQQPQPQQQQQPQQQPVQQEQYQLQQLQPQLSIASTESKPSTSGFNLESSKLAQLSSSQTQRQQYKQQYKQQQQPTYPMNPEKKMRSEHDPPDGTSGVSSQQQQQQQQQQATVAEFMGPAVPSTSYGPQQSPPSTSFQQQSPEHPPARHQSPQFQPAQEFQQFSPLGQAIQQPQAQYQPAHQDFSQPQPQPQQQQQFYQPQQYHTPPPQPQYHSPTPSQYHSPPSQQQYHSPPLQQQQQFQSPQSQVQQFHSPQSQQYHSPTPQQYHSPVPASFSGGSQYSTASSQVQYQAGAPQPSPPLYQQAQSSDQYSQMQDTSYGQQPQQYQQPVQYATQQMPRASVDHTRLPFQPTYYQQTDPGSNFHYEYVQSTEIAKPYRFRTNRFSQMAQSRHSESSGSTRYSAYEGSYAGPYVYNTPPATVSYRPTQQQPRPQQPFPQPQASPGLQQQRFPQPGPASPAFAGPGQQLPHAQYIQPPGGPVYAPLYSPQQQADQQMQLDYPGDAQMVVAENPFYETSSSNTNRSRDRPMDDDTPSIDMQEVPYQEGQYWCSISYHEYDQRIGEKYHSNCRVLCVDGYTQPMCPDRFCIGGISNINRHHFTEWVRRRIGRGVRFTYVDGEVYVEGLSESSVFVSNPLRISEEGNALIEHVSKLTQGCTAKVFSTEQFSKLLTDSVSLGFEAVYKLTNYCVIRVSFVKGWGRNYKRQSIFNTPCWVEVQLNGPLQWIDKVLRQMKPPAGCGSTS